jgi:hypothetical protein
MKKTIPIIGLICCLILISCGGEKTLSSDSKTTSLVGKTFKTSDIRFWSLTFLNESEVIYSFPGNDGDRNDYIYNYTVKDSTITIDRIIKKSVMNFYNQNMIIERWDPTEWEGKLRCTTFILQ